MTGILLGPYAMDLMAPELLAISADIRKIALIVILVRAGLTVDLGDLKKIGRPAVLMTFLPATFEILAVILLAPKLLGITLLEAAILGAVLGAVSPAVVVPRMSSSCSPRSWACTPAAGSRQSRFFPFQFRLPWVCLAVC